VQSCLTVKLSVHRKHQNSQFIYSKVIRLLLKQIIDKKLFLIFFVVFSTRNTILQAVKQFCQAK